MRLPTFILALIMAGTATAGVPVKLTLDVQNMTCAGCPITIKKALEQVPGVSDVKIDYERKTASMHVDQSKADEAMLTKATADAGFPSTLRK